MTLSVLWSFLWQDILIAEAETRLPGPPLAPAFALETRRPPRMR